MLFVLLVLMMVVQVAAFRTGAMLRHSQNKLALRMSDKNTENSAFEALKAKMAADPNFDPMKGRFVVAGHSFVFDLLLLFSF